MNFHGKDIKIFSCNSNIPVAKQMAEAVCFVLEKCAELNNASHSIGCTLEDPFMTMAFMSLPVIPELKVTDKGIFEYILGGCKETKLLDVRVFDEATKKRIYKKSIQIHH